MLSTFMPSKPFGPGRTELVDKVTGVPTSGLFFNCFMRTGGMIFELPVEEIKMSIPDTAFSM